MTFPAVVPVAFPSATLTTPVDDHAADTGRLAPKTLGLTGQVEYELDLGGADLRWIEDDHVGVPPLGDAAPGR